MIGSRERALHGCSPEFWCADKKALDRSAGKRLKDACREALLHAGLNEGGGGGDKARADGPGSTKMKMGRAENLGWLPHEASPGNCLSLCLFCCRKLFPRLGHVTLALRQDWQRLAQLLPVPRPATMPEIPMSKVQAQQPPPPEPKPRGANRSTKVAGKLKVLPEQPEVPDLAGKKGLTQPAGPSKEHEGSVGTTGSSDEGDVDEDEEQEDVEVNNVHAGQLDIFLTMRHTGLQSNIANTRRDGSTGCLEAHQEKGKVSAPSDGVRNGKVLLAHHSLCL